MQRFDWTFVFRDFYHLCLPREYVFPIFMLERAADEETASDFLEPDNYDFSGTRAIAIYDDDDVSSVLSSPSATPRPPSVGSSEKPQLEGTEKMAVVETQSVDLSRGQAASTEVLQSAFKRALWYSLSLAVIVTIIGARSQSQNHPSYGEKREK